MGLNDYAFFTRWRVQATVAEVDKVLADAASLPRWWPSVYLDVRILRPGDARGVGKTVELLTQGWLPYRLGWSFVTTEVRPDGFTLEADGTSRDRASGPSSRQATRWTSRTTGGSVRGSRCCARCRGC